MTPPAATPAPLDAINAMDEEAFVAAFGGLYEHSPWAAARAYGDRPFASLDAVIEALGRAVERAGPEAHLALIRAHPELGAAARAPAALTQHSRAEQASVGLDRLEHSQTGELFALNGAYQARFGFPFVICARLHSQAQIFEALRTRLEADRDVEIQTALAQIALIARLRFDDAVTRLSPPTEQ